MANKTINEYPESTSPSGEWYVLVDDGTGCYKKVKLKNLPCTCGLTTTSTTTTSVSGSTTTTTSTTTTAIPGTTTSSTTTTPGSTTTSTTTTVAGGSTTTSTTTTSSGTTTSSTTSTTTSSSTSSTTSTTTTIQYDYYYANVYDCTNCGAGPVQTNFVVAFPQGSIVVINGSRYYLPASGPNGYSYQTVGAAPGGPGLVLTDAAWFPDCTTACTA